MREIVMPGNVAVLIDVPRDAEVVKVTCTVPFSINFYPNEVVRDETYEPHSPGTEVTIGVQKLPLGRGNRPLCVYTEKSGTLVVRY